MPWMKEFHDLTGQKCFSHTISITSMVADLLALKLMYMDFKEQQVPKFTQNQNGRRNLVMHQTKKGNEWCFGIKYHASSDAGSEYAHFL